jgi:D-alanine-D-alanine ligase
VSRSRAHILVAFDAEFARRTQLHNARHPVKKGDDFFSMVGDAGPVGEALSSAGFRVSRLGVGRDAASTLPRALKKGVDLVFNLCDTVDGDSRLAPVVPSLLEAAGVPFAGADQFGLAISKRKHDVKALLDRERLPTPRYQVVAAADELDDFQLTLEAPVILKLTAEHSSIGLASSSVCFDEAEVKAHARGLFKRFGQPVLIEEYVHGREFYVSFYGRPFKALPMMEHSFEALPDGFLPIRTFDMKWFNDPKKGGEKPKKDPRWALPVPHRASSTPWQGSLDDIPAVCRRALEVSGGRDWGRVDLRLDRGGVPHIIDVTPNTYLGPSAPCVKAAESDGLSYQQLVTRIAREALR